MTTINNVWDAILATLKDMGREATASGKPYGLRGFPDYLRECEPGCFRKAAWEEPLSEGIARGLRRRGFPTSPELFYPLDGRSDLVIDIGNEKKLWVECKTAFRQCLGPPKPDYGYNYDYEGDNYYDPGRGRDSWVAGVSDIKSKDMPKLLSLLPAEAEFIGILLLGFDLVLKPLTNRELQELLPSELATWRSAHVEACGVVCPDSYSVRANKGFRERVWFWYRPVSDVETLPPAHATAEVNDLDAEQFDEKMLLEVKYFCKIPYSQHGNRQKTGPYRGWYAHDWGHLVQRVSRLKLGRELPIPDAWEIGNLVRRQFKNAGARDWNYAVNRPGAHELILSIILRQLS